ncbi:MAG TPA: serine/threonine-protein kinase [Gemmatimonadaceae bacterium]|nr:serine/threonine-protein kinase [Gemmatimonadaceae bacterium]
MDTIAQLNASLAGRYAVEREIGQGGMATVFLARDLKHDRRVALKVLKAELGAILGVERFLSEIKVTANLQHPNLLPLFDSGEADGLLFYVMPFMEGESLRNRLEREKQLPVEDAIRIAVAVASALEYAHAQGVIHRDLKPENILLQGGQPVIADFGIALAVSSAGGSRLTASGISLGTPQYMSPEQAAGDRVIDGRSDIYALGAVAYETLTGEPPHTGTTAQAIFARVLTERPRSVRAMRPAVPEHVEFALAHALEKLPADRYSTAAQFAAALQPGAATSVATARRLAIRTPARWRTAAMLVTAAVLGAAVAWRFGGAPGGSEEVRHWSISLPDSAPLVAARNRDDVPLRSLAVSHDGKSIVYVSATNGGTRLMLLRLNIGTAAPLRGTEGAMFPAFAPDGAAVAFAVGRELRRVSLADGSVTRIATANFPTDIVWHSDNRLYLADAGDCFASVAATGGEPVRLAKRPCLLTHIAPLGPRSDWFLASFANLSYVVSRSTGEMRRLLEPVARNSRAPGAPLAGGFPLFVPPHTLLFVRDSTLMAAPFDAQALRLTGEPQIVLSGVQQEQSGNAYLGMAGDGTLVWAPGTDAALSRFVWAGEDGHVRDTLFVGRSIVGGFALTPDGHRLAILRRFSSGRSSLIIADLRRRVLDSIPTDLTLRPVDWIRGGRDLIALMRRPDGSERSVVVHLGSGPAVVDSSDQSFANESADGSLRCGATAGPLALWRTSAPANTTPLDAQGGGICQFSPDGNFVVWESETGLMMAPTDNRAAAARVQLAPLSAKEPRWSRDGRQVYYRTGGSWFVVPVPADLTKPEVSPRLLFEGQFLQAFGSWDRGPDGRFLVLQGTPRLRAPRLNVITNFPRFLEETLRSAK